MQTRIALTVVVAVVLAVSSGAQASDPGRQPILGATFGSSSGELLRLDPVTLEPIGQPLARLGFSWSVLPSTDGTRLVITSGGDPLRIVDPASGRVISHLAAGRVTLTPGAWSRPDRLLSVTPWQHSSLVVVDPKAGRVLQRRPLGGDILGGVASRGWLVLLVGTPGRIRPARLVVVSPGGSMRTVTLPGRRAAVVGGDGSVAIVNLATLAVRTHRVEARQLASARKELTGSSRVVAWLTPTILAVSGVDFGTASAGTSDTRPAGLRLIHTGDWSSRVVDGEASQVVIAGGSALVTDGTGGGIGLRAYTPNGRMRFHLLGGEALDDMLVIRNRVYVGVRNSWCYRVVDPDAGRVISSPLPHRQTVLIS